MKETLELIGREAQKICNMLTEEHHMEEEMEEEIIQPVQTTDIRRQ